MKYEKRIPSLFKLAELIFFPSFCKLCSSLLEFPKERVVCNSCWEEIQPPRLSYCICCGRFFDQPGEPHPCGECLRSRPVFSLHRSCARYEGKLKEIIILYKYMKFRVLGKELAHFIHRALGKDEMLWWNVQTLVPVPLHPRREKERGFNQARIMAKELAKIKRLELSEGILQKQKNIPAQTSLEAEERKKNVRGAFKVKRGEEIEGKVLLLIDDVFTTGATLTECARVLREAGAKEVRALTLAQA